MKTKKAQKQYGKQIRTLRDLWYAAAEGKAVVVPGIIDHPQPASWVINRQWADLFRLMELKMYVYKAPI